MRFRHAGDIVDASIGGQFSFGGRKIGGQQFVDVLAIKIEIELHARQLCLGKLRAALIEEGDGRRSSPLCTTPTEKRSMRLLRRLIK